MGGWAWTGGLTGDTLSIGGRGAQGDLTGGGAGLFAVKVSFSFPAFDVIAAFACCCCLSAFAPSRSTVAFGPTVVEDLEKRTLEVSRLVD